MGHRYDVFDKFLSIFGTEYLGHIRNCCSTGTRAIREDFLSDKKK
jgi:hypothetical protein